MVWPQADIGFIKGAKTDLDHQIIVGSTQTLMQADRRKSLPPFGFIVYDECHHGMSEKNSLTMSEITHKNAIVLGVTATPNRTDQKALGLIFADEYGQGPVYERSILEMISEGYLAPIRGIRGNLVVELSNVKETAGDYQLDSLSKVMNTPAVNKAIYEFWEQHAKERKTIVFATDVKHAKALTDEFVRHNVKARYITGSLSELERDRLLQAFAQGEIQVIVNCNILTEGFDEPSISCILFARPTKSTSLYTQMLGRGLRLYPGKKDCLVLDAVRNSKKHNLLVVADLFPKQKPHEHYQEAARGETKEEEIYVGRAWFESQSAEVYSSEFSWEVVPKGGFRLRLIGSEIRIQKHANGWYPVYFDKDGQQSFMFDQPLTIEYAMGLAEDKVREMQFGIFARKSAPWRNRPASDKQIETLKKLRLDIPAGLNQGDADSLIRTAIDKLQRSY